MKVPARRQPSNIDASPIPSGQLSRRRLVALLAVSAGALATLAGCGGEQELTRDDYSFPGAEKDASGNYKMRGFR